MAVTINETFRSKFIFKDWIKNEALKKNKIPYFFTFIISSCFSCDYESLSSEF
jgi:hypothetical protein